MTTAAERLTQQVLLPFGLAYFLCYGLRVVPATIGPELRAALGLSNSQLGLLTSAFFLAFTLMQLPLGAALDRYGPRRVQGVLLSVAAVGAVLFAAAPTAPWLFAGRFVMGLGAAGGLMAAFKAMALWYPRERLPAMNGLIFAIGALGGIAATLPVERLLQWMPWRGLFLLAAVSLLLAVLIIQRAVPRRAEEQRQSGRAPATADGALRVYGQLLRERDFQFAAITNAVSNGFGLAFWALWMGAWLRDVPGLALGPQSQWLMAMNLFNMVGFWLIGWLAARLARSHGLPLHWWMAAGTLLLVLALLAGQTGQIGFWFLVAFTSGISTVSYAFVTQRFPNHWSGRANALLNVATFGAAFACQYGFGLLLDARLSQGRSVAGAYSDVFLVLAGVAALTAVAMLFRWPRLHLTRPNSPSSRPSEA